jgi:PAS domain S-box-containing protein
MSDYKQLNQLLKGDILNYQIEKRVIKKDDSIIWIHITRSLIKQNEKQPIIFTVIEDVNLKKRTENILTQAFENYKNLAENSPDIIYRFDRNLNCLYTNPSVSRISGRGPEERIGRNLSDFAKPEQFTAWQKRFEKVIETKKREYYQDILRTLEGEKTIETIFVPEFDLERNITSFLTLSRDITERIHAQEEIQRKNILLEKILDNIPAGVWIIDEKGSLMMYNKACELIWGGVENLSIRKKPQLNAWWADTGKKIEDNEWGSYKAYTQGETSLNEIINIETSNGIKKTIMNSAVPMFDNNKKIIGVVVINQDISKLMKIENDLKNSLAEKEMLMKEIHHRVKNNFQIIASLLNLQRTSVKNRNIEDVLLESQNRINSMAILHEKLYKSKNFQKINFAVYLKGLIKSLESSYKTGEKDISLIFDIDELFVSTDYAINLGLIINELVSNSLKHAFKDKNKGTVAIFLKKEKNDLQLTVKDDGVGISKEFDIKNTESLGMLLINSFVEQIKGKTELNCECGTEFKIVFPKERE